MQPKENRIVFTKRLKTKNMKKEVIYLLSSITLGFCLIACDEETIEASEGTTERSYSFSDYTGVRIEGAFKADITFSETEESIIVESNENLQDKIVVQKEGNLLRFDLAKDIGVRGDIVLKAHIKTKSLSYFKADGVSDITLKNKLSAPISEIDISGSSNFYGEIDVDTLRLNISGTSDVDIYGRAHLLQASLSTSSDLKDYDFAVDKLEIDLKGACESYLTVNEHIDIEASGTSALNYKGSASILNQNLSGVAKINKKD